MYKKVTLSSYLSVSPALIQLLAPRFNIGPVVTLSILFMKAGVEVAGHISAGNFANYSTSDRVETTCALDCAHWYNSTAGPVS